MLPFQSGAASSDLEGRDPEETLSPRDPLQRTKEERCAYGASSPPPVCTYGTTSSQTAGAKESWPSLGICILLGVIVIILLGFAIVTQHRHWPSIAKTTTPVPMTDVAHLDFGSRSNSLVSRVEAMEGMQMDFVQPHVLVGGPSPTPSQTPSPTPNLIEEQPSIPMEGQSRMQALHAQLEDQPTAQARL